MRILFIGNSFTWVNDVPNLVRQIWEADGSHQSVQVERIDAGHLEDLAGNRGVFDKIKNGRWNAVVFEGAMVSMSLTRDYPQDTAISLANTARKAGAKPYLFVEWPRRGIDETDYTLNVYWRIATPTKSRVIPVCRVWDRALKMQPQLDLYSPDGNHASALGSYLAACTIYRYISGRQIPANPWVIPGLPKEQVSVILKAVRAQEIVS
ncbi:MAG: hypothetical protein JSS72_12435 [Armatimonadetes bacterium]|nr:hypothetical protein [Armatimonadota bacterium]